ncbi:hypothetical protein CGZ91_00335 [Parenemella sanctibonifatiensis]|uniref:Glycosyltransferase subfamily 4-like N-terminal domain-containing protein n=2 Tax=Parenemella sanctibonifatiensis TaxID=2016505 RepID=A0A255EKF9_9ACTN|nr:hypothetical protein CGZ91_00335 [Parenemella sanctibonifatiensis]
MRWNAMQSDSTSLPRRNRPMLPDPPPARVALVSDYTLDTLGGAEHAFGQAALALAEAGHPVLVASPASARLAKLGAYPGVTAVGTPILGRLPHLQMPVARRSRRLVSMIAGLLRRSRTQVVHLHSEFGLAAAAIAAARQLHLPVLQTVHTFFWQTTLPVQKALAATAGSLHSALTGLRFPAYQDWRGLAERPGDAAMRGMTLSVARRVDRVISPSAHQAGRLRDCGIDHVDVIPNAGPGLPEAAPVDGVEGPLRVVWIGRLCPEKQILFFLGAVRSAQAELGPGRLEVEVIGDGDLRGQVQQLAGSTPGVSVLGPLPREEVIARLAGSHLSAMTSRGWDNQPMTVAESIRALRPVLYRDPALVEGLAGTDGAGIPAFGDQQAYAAALIDLARHPERVVAASRAALVAREEFSTPTHVQRLRASYRLAQEGPLQ